MSVAVPIRCWRIRQRISITELQLAALMTWGGLRGAISIALLLSLSAPAQNAAFHYWRALIHLSRLDEGRLDLPSKLVWEVLPCETLVVHSTLRFPL